MDESLHCIGHNIRTLRRRRGWTLARLAAESGLSEIPLGRIERGEHLPSALAVYRLCRALTVTADVLFAETDIARDRGLRVRTGGPLPVGLEGGDAAWPAAVQSLAVELMGAFQALEDLCGVPKRARIPLSFPFEPSWDGMEFLSETVRHAMGIEHGVLFDYLETFENCGFRVIHAPLPREFDGFSWLDPPNQNAFFFLNSRRGTERRLFRLAWELGKLLIFNAELQHGGPLFPRGVGAAETIWRAGVPPARGYGTDDVEPGRADPARRAGVSPVSAAVDAHGAPRLAGPAEIGPTSSSPEAPEPADSVATHGGGAGRVCTADRAARRFAATFLMPAPAVRESVRQLGIAPDRWTYELLLRLKHRFGVSAESFLYRLDELALISPGPAAALQASLRSHYARAGYVEPDDSRRILTPNGRLGDLLTVARARPDAREELPGIERTLERWEVMV